MSFSFAHILHQFLGLGFGSTEMRPVLFFDQALDQRCPANSFSHRYLIRANKSLIRIASIAGNLSRSAAYANVFFRNFFPRHQPQPFDFSAYNSTTYCAHQSPLNARTNEHRIVRTKINLTAINSGYLLNTKKPGRAPHAPGSAHGKHSGVLP